MSKLSDFISIKHGFAFKGEFITTEENANCLITPVNFSIGGGFKSDKFKYYTGEIPEKYILQPNDLIVTMTDLSKQADTLGYPALVPNISGKKMLHNQRIGLVEFLNNELDKEYLYFLMRTKDYRHQILSTATGATVHHTSPSKILDFEFEKPDLQTQKLIAQYLMILEEKIQLNTQINQTLEAIAQAIFKSWFVDFDPVRAKAQAISDGKTNDEANLSAMAVISGKAIEDLSQTEYQELWEIADAFPSELVENAEFGEVPKGWGIAPLSTFGEIICGKTPTKSKSEYYGNNIPFIKIPDMHGKVFITQTIDNLSLIGANSQATKYISKGSICVSCIATVGLVSLVSRKSQTNQQINSIVPNNLNFSEYLYLYLSQSEMNKYMKSLASGGSATLNMNTSTFSSIQILKPNNEILDLFHKKSLDIFEKILKNEENNQILAQTRDLLLPKLLSGEIEL